MQPVRHGPFDRSNRKSTQDASGDVFVAWCRLGQRRCNNSSCLVSDQDDGYRCFITQTMDDVDASNMFILCNWHGLIADKYCYMARLWIINVGVNETCLYGSPGKVVQRNGPFGRMWPLQAVFIWASASLDNSAFSTFLNSRVRSSWLSFLWLRRCYRHSPFMVLLPLVSSSPFIFFHNW